MAMFLEYNGHPLSCTDEDLEYLGIGVASGKLRPEDVLEWIMNRSTYD